MRDGLGERNKTHSVETHGAEQTHGPPPRPTAGFGFSLIFSDGFGFFFGF
jgi:hypothetical protein